MEDYKLIESCLNQYIKKLTEDINNILYKSN